MSNSLAKFEKLVRSAKNVGIIPTIGGEGSHPFDERNIHPEIAKVSLALFDDGHYSQSTFEAFKVLDNTVKDLSRISETGFKLMMAAFNETAPKIELNNLLTASDKDEQLGFRHVFAGVMAAIRNPRGHEIKTDTIDLCLTIYLLHPCFFAHWKIERNLRIDVFFQSPDSSLLHVARACRGGSTTAAWLSLRCIPWCVLNAGLSYRHVPRPNPAPHTRQ